MLRRPASRPSAGFTLTELLIVLVVLSLLLSIVVPAARRLPAIARSAKCQTNLAHMVQAYQACKNYDTYATGLQVSLVHNWHRLLMPLLGNNDFAVLCPEDESPVPTGTSVRLTTTSGCDIRPFSLDPIWNEVSAAEAPGRPSVWKLNDDDYNRLEPDIRQGHNIRGELPKYTPGSDPNKYHFVMEDAGDQDYEDVILTVTEDPAARTMTLEFKSGSTVFDYTMYAPDGKVHELGQAARNNTGPYTFPLIGDVSYGMNWRVDRFRLGEKKILFIDYNKYVVYTGQGQEDQWAKYSEARHLGKCNVAFSDGSVELKKMDEIDPTVEAIRLKHWDPAHHSD